MKQKYLTMLLGIVVITTTIAAPFASSQTITSTSVFTHDDSSIYVNWRDVASGNSAYSFEVQRIRLTPLPDTNLTATKAGPNSVTLDWNNATVSTPYHAIIERSTLANAASRFDATNDNTLKTVTTNVYEPWNGSRFVAKSAWSYTDSSASADTMYYYRIRECSDITPVYMKLSDGAVRLNSDPNFKPIPVCTMSYVSTSIDMTPPPPPPPPAGGLVVVSVSPAPQATDVPTNTKIVATFSKKMDPVTVNTNSFKVYNATLARGQSLGVQINGTVVVDATGFKATFTPSALLRQTTTYNGWISKTVKDINGNTLANDYVWSFVTEPSGTPPPSTCQDPAATNFGGPLPCDYPPPPPPAGCDAFDAQASATSWLTNTLTWTDNRTDEDGEEITNNVDNSKLVFPPGPYMGDAVPPADVYNTNVQSKPNGTGISSSWDAGPLGGLRIGSSIRPNTDYTYTLRPFYFAPLPCPYRVDTDPPVPPTGYAKCDSGYTKTYLCSVSASVHSNWALIATTTAKAGNGRVYNNQGINCGSGASQTQCFNDFPYVQSQQLTAEPAPGYSFDGWLINGSPLPTQCPDSSLTCAVSAPNSAPSNCPLRFGMGCATPFTAVNVTAKFKPSAGVTATISANPTSIRIGDTSAVSWSSSGANDCVYTGTTFSLGASGSMNFGSTGAGTQDFNITCTGPGGSASATASVTILSPSGSISASPCNIVSPATSCSTTVSWNSTDARNPAVYAWDWATASRGALLSSGVANGSIVVPGVVAVPPGNATAFVLDSDLVGVQGAVTLNSVSVAAGGTPAAPTLTLTRSPITVADGGASRLTWSTTGASSCTASSVDEPDWTGAKPTAGTELVAPSNGPGTLSHYTLTCSGPGGVKASTVTVRVSGTHYPPIAYGQNPQSNLASGNTPKSFIGKLGATILDSIISFFSAIFSPTNSGSPAPSPAPSPVQDVAPAPNPALSPAPAAGNGNQAPLGQQPAAPQGPAAAQNPAPRSNWNGSIEPYYVTISNVIKQPVILDKGLSPDVVYMYRVRVSYANGSKSAWSQPKASRTFSRAGVAQTSASAPVCTRNSYCAFSIKGLVNTAGEASEVQCRNNNDCGKIGKSRSSVQEK